jgi:acetylornithine deacetylase/succinyl-diaminopimelate desuccinylase-like protein
MRLLVYEILSREGLAPDEDTAEKVITAHGSAGNEVIHQVLNTHLDTVPPQVPFEHNGDVLRGRGASDIESPLETLIDTFRAATLGDGLSQD